MALKKWLTVRSLLLALLISAALSLAITLIPYAYYFAGQRPTHNPQDWGLFGDYVGGTLNTLFAFSAFAGVLLTVWIQNQILEHERKQATIIETQNLIATLAERLDLILARRLDIQACLLLSRTVVSKHATVETIVAALARAKAQKHQFNILWAEASPLVDFDLARVYREIIDIGDVILEFQSRGGDEFIIKYYRRRYREIATWTYILGLNDGPLTKLPPRIVEYFGAVEVAQFASDIFNKADPPQD